MSSATRWLALAVCAVAASGAFAVLIALARVPALGTFFPGPDFYRVALTLHVNLSQGVWFMAFAGALWSLGSSRQSRVFDRLAWLAAVFGTLGIILSVLYRPSAPLMSNYLPVLDSPVFLMGIFLFGLGVAVKASVFLVGAQQPATIPLERARKLALALAAIQLLAALAIIAGAGKAIHGRLEGHAFFENLFWGGGHVWQFALISLLMFCWLELAREGGRRLSPAGLRLLLILGAMPVAAALAIPWFDAPGSGRYADAYTWLMQWTSWEAPLALGIMLWWRGSNPAPGFGLSMVLFVAGLVLGASINGQTTLVTAHYHGTIGAVTLAFMAAGFALLPRLGLEPPSSRTIRIQLGFYGYGILLMMLGLAGAGLMGAPRKTPGDLAMAWSVEAISRICLGMGGVLATIGIVAFAVLLLRRLFPMGDAAVCPR